MNSLKYCVDTHALIWYFTGQKTLSLKAQEVLNEIFAGKYRCYVASIVLLEAFHVSLKHKKFHFPKFLKALQLSNIIIVPLDQVVLLTCFRLPKDLNIHDRVVVSTAIVNKSTLVTKDEHMRKISSVKTLW